MLKEMIIFKKMNGLLNTNGINLLELFTKMILMHQEHIQMIFMKYMNCLVLKQQEQY